MDTLETLAQATTVIPPLSLQIPETEWSPVSSLRPEAAQLYAGLLVEKFPFLPQLTNGRIPRAVEIVKTAGACRPSGLPGVYQVQSASGKGFYEVDTNAKTCSCPDDRQNTQRETNIPCKHRLAIAIHILGPQILHEQLVTGQVSPVVKWGGQTIPVELIKINEACAGQKVVAVRAREGEPFPCTLRHHYGEHSALALVSPEDITIEKI